MSHVNTLSLSKECIVHCHIVCLSRLVMLPSRFVVPPVVDRGFEEVLPLQSTQSFVSLSLSQSYGYYIHIIPKLCSEFRVVDVGLIMALLRRDFSHRHQLIIREIILETIFSTLSSVYLNDRFSRSRHRFTSLTFDRQNQLGVRRQDIYSYSVYCTRVP